ncbi:MAG: hypothetical protein ACHQ50_02260 [Fimbriimonadales bacterium]
MVPLIVCLAGLSGGQTYTGPRITVKPVFCVAADAQNPAQVETRRLMRYLKITQARYLELLEGLDTFQLADSPVTWRCPATASELQKKPNGGAEYVVNELLKKDHVTRWTCPYVYVVIFVGTGDFPGGGGGRPINGGHDRGGGIVILSGSLLQTAPNVQSTLQHELGHAFGLPHVDVYGYDMLTNPSIMSYNPGHHTSYFKVSPTPGRLIPEDMRALAENKLAFPNYRFDPSQDVPSGYSLRNDVELGPMELASHT